MSAPLAEKDCPDPDSHGNPFRYCPHCTWAEEPESVAVRTDQEWLDHCKAVESRAVRAEAALDAIEAMLTKKKRMGTLFDVQQIRLVAQSPKGAEE